MRAYRKHIFVLGISVALVMSAAITLPYILIWNSYNSENREINTVKILGETSIEKMSDSLVNLTLIAIYPKAAVYAYDNMFTIQLVFLVALDPNITDFRIYDLHVEFRNWDWSIVCIGYSPTEYQSDFYRHSQIGNMPPYFTDLSIVVRSGRWPPSYAANLLYFADRVETFPEIRLNGAITLNNDNRNSSMLGFSFDMGNYSTAIYCFNYPSTLWIIYGSSLFIAIGVSVNYLLKKRACR